MNMYKYVSQLAFFRFNSSFSKGNLTITWFVVDDDEDGGRCFSSDELKEFANFVATRPDNFPGGKNHHQCDEEEDLPYCGIETVMENENIEYPNTFVLRKKPLLISNSKTNCVDILLTDNQGNDDHTYNLGFDVIGTIN